MFPNCLAEQPVLCLLCLTAPPGVILVGYRWESGGKSETQSKQSYSEPRSLFCSRHRDLISSGPPPFYEALRGFLLSGGLFCPGFDIRMF